MAMEADGFQLVKKKKAAKRSVKIKESYAGTSNNSDDERTSETIEVIVSKIQRYRNELLTSTFYRAFLDVCGKSGLVRISGASEPRPGLYQSLVCYGIGHIASCSIAQYQLALLLALRDLAQDDKSQCYVYDPVLTHKEKELLNLLELKVLEENEEGTRCANEPTIFYMPHCGKPLYNNLLWRNWSIELLQNVAIIGNSFTYIVESTPKRILVQEAALIEKVQPHTCELTIDNVFKHSDIFNNTSVHTFSKVELEKVEKEFWTVLPKPSYDNNVEIIRRLDTIS